jgi:hypothetical protein
MVALMLEGLRASGIDMLRSLEEIFGGDPFPSTDVSHPSTDSVKGLFSHHQLYNMHATHLRMTPIYSCFTGLVKAARVTLHDHWRLPFFTKLGTIWNHDHIVFIAKEDPNFMDFERVDLITAARRDLDRFAPVALFLGYEKKDSPEPSFFILESGYATGQPAVLYFAPTIDSQIVHHTSYMPTPFTSPDNWYTSTLTLRDGDEPNVLAIEGREQLDERPYIALTIEYESIDEPGDIPVPEIQQIEAALRLAAIAKAMPQCDLNELETLIADYARKHFEWNLKPEDG